MTGCKPIRRIRRRWIVLLMFVAAMGTCYWDARRRTLPVLVTSSPANVGKVLDLSWDIGGRCPPNWLECSYWSEEKRWTYWADKSNEYRVAPGQAWVNAVYSECYTGKIALNVYYRIVGSGSNSWLQAGRTEPFELSEVQDVEVEIDLTRPRGNEATFKYTR